MDKMDKVVSINRDMFLGWYSDAQYSERIPEVVAFVVGVISTVGLPQLILSVYGGVITFVVLAGATLVGTLIGLVVYQQVPYQLPHCVDAVTVAQSPPYKGNQIAARRA